MQRKERKIGFLVMELQDIKNNKGSITMQVRSIEHLQNWLKNSSRLSSELNIRPLDLSLAMVDLALVSPGKTNWWDSEDNEEKEAEVKFKSVSKEFEKSHS